MKGSKASWECKTVTTMHSMVNSNEVLLEILGGYYFFAERCRMLEDDECESGSSGQGLKKKA